MKYVMEYLRCSIEKNEGLVKENMHLPVTIQWRVGGTDARHGEAFVSLSRAEPF